jgi:hydrogenase maturation protease
MPPTRHILIAGVGNVLLSDDGVGIHAVRELQKQPIPGVTVADIGTAILHGISFLETAWRVLVIDAAKGGQPPGTIYLFDADEPAVLPPTSSVHAMGLREAMRLLPVGVPRPRLAVLGVEPESLAYGMELSRSVQAVLEQVVRLARDTVRSWQNELAVAQSPVADAAFVPV